MPRHNGNKLLSFKKLSFSAEIPKDTSPEQNPLNDTLDLFNFTNAIKGNNDKEMSVVSTDASLSSYTDIDSLQTFPDSLSLMSEAVRSDVNLSQNYSNLTQQSTQSSFDYLMSSRADSVSLSEGLSQNNYNHLLSSPAPFHRPSSTQNHQISKSTHKQLQQEWIEIDRNFNKMCKQRPKMDEIIHFNDRLRGDPTAEYYNFDFVWIKLKFATNQKISCCWWPAQICMNSNIETTKSQKRRIQIRLFTSLTFGTKQNDKNYDKNFMFSMSRKRIIPFEHLLVEKNIKIFKYLMQFYIDPLLLKKYNLQWIVSNEQMSKKKRQKLLYSEFKNVLRKTHEIWLKKQSKTANLCHFNHCIDWKGDVAINYKKAQIVFVKGDPLHLIHVDGDEKRINLFFICKQVWWPAIVLMKSSHHRNKADDAVTVNLCFVNIQCDYKRTNVIPVDKEWFLYNNGQRNNIYFVRTLAKQILLTSRCEYKIYQKFENAMDKISKYSVIKQRCFHYKEWKIGQRKYKKIQKKIEQMKANSDRIVENNEGKTTKKKQKKSKKKDKETKKKKKKKKYGVEPQFEGIYGKLLTSDMMKQIVIDRKNKRNLWNFVNNVHSFSGCIHHKFHPVQLSFCLKPPPNEESERQRVELFNNAMNELAQKYPLKHRQKRSSAKFEEVFSINMYRRLYIYQNVSMCQDILYFADDHNVFPMIMSTNCTQLRLSNTLRKRYCALFQHRYPRNISKSALVPNGTLSKAYLSKMRKHRKGWFIIWYLRFIRLLKYYLECRLYDYCLQIICLLLPVALREFNLFIHETEFLIRASLFLLNYFDDEYQRKKYENVHNDKIYDSNHLHAIVNILDCFREFGGWKLSCLIGKDRFYRMNEVLDVQKIAWFIKQQNLTTNEMKKIFKNDDNAKNFDVNLLEVIVLILCEKWGYKMNEKNEKRRKNNEKDDEMSQNKDHRNEILESMAKRRRKSIVSTRSRRRDRKRIKRSWNDFELEPMRKKQRLLAVGGDDDIDSDESLSGDEFDVDDVVDYAADTENEDDDDSDNQVTDVSMHHQMDDEEGEDDMKESEVSSAKELNDDVIEIVDDGDVNEHLVTMENEKWQVIMNKLEQCVAFNPCNDSYLFFMFELLTKYKPKMLKNEHLQRVYQHILKFIEFEPTHPNGYRYAIMFCLKFEHDQDKIFGYLEKLIHFDVESDFIHSCFETLRLNESAIYKLKVMYLELLHAMNLIEIGQKCLNLMQWSKLYKICNQIISELTLLTEACNTLQIEIISKMLSLIRAKHKYWKCLYFNPQIIGDINEENEMLSVKLQCCLALYGNKHSFIDDFKQKCQNKACPKSLKSFLDRIKNTKCVKKLCKELKESEDKYDIVSILNYGKLNVLEPVICCSPYYLKNSPYCKVFEPWKGLMNEKYDIGEGMLWDNCNPFNEKHKYELTKYKMSTLQQLHHQLGIFHQFSNTNCPNRKKKLVDSCWSLMTKLKKQNDFLSHKALCVNVEFDRFNENIRQFFV